MGSGGSTGTGGSGTGGSVTAGSGGTTVGSGGTSSTGGSTNAGGSGVVTGKPGCGLDSAAFCDTFDAPAKTRGRAGDLDPKWWSAGRLAPQGPTANGQAFGVTAATLRPSRIVDGTAKQLPACRAGLADQVFPDDDTLVCDPSADIGSNHLLVAVGSQNYGSNSYRVRQPFDFAGRTGKIVFDAEATAGGLLGWISVDVTEDPIAVPSFQTLLNDEGGVLPKNGLSIQITETCAGTTGTNASVGEVHVFDNYAETILKRPSGSAPVCIPIGWGKLNHFEIDVSQTHVDVKMSPVSSDGKTFGATQLAFATDVKLPFTRGYVHIITHNHATLKYSASGSGFGQGFTDLDAWIARWDNVGFDGPVVGGWREYEAADSLVPSQWTDNTGHVIKVMNIGWTVADVSKGPSSTIHFHGVDVSGATRAQIALTSWYCLGCGPSVTNFALKYRINGGAWHDRPLSAGELADATGGKCQGALGQLLDVPITELVSGDNTLELVSSNVPQNYPPGVTNVDLVLATK